MESELQKSTLSQHLSELRKRLFICILLFIITTSISFLFVEETYQFLTKPLMHALMKGSNDKLALNYKLIFTSVTEGFFTYMHLAIFLGFISALPIIISQIYFFISPGLYKKEKKLILYYIISSIILFIFGGIIAYYVALPLAHKFFVSFESEYKIDSLAIVFIPKMSEYLNFAISMIIGFGLAFQMPIIITLLTKLELLDPNVLVKYRRHAIVIIFIISAVLTPPDVISQIILAIPLLVLYELSLFISMKIKNNSLKQS